MSRCDDFLAKNIFLQILAPLSAISPPMARLGFFVNDFFLQPYARAKIRTHISRVTPTWHLLKDALPTKLPRSGF